ncbi:hypothetical protein BBW65_06460 [Helicobacter enhydrae]|uniref:MotA/TolQ/ExbB proton channel domain-containing protein n=1 Tax=Helicobacter enhydrae TaxID=222136 RepID=A0A1B1U6S3_9HELI|nr:MotA/TolQ/ExbB proton channel family protein [Helicobacter enhydrae]ANV98459.1 hypothetical protein BBW65_06460 [Helicobacter enhydrae]
MTEMISNFLHTSSLVGLLVLCWLCFYLFLTLWVFIYRFWCLGALAKAEQKSLQKMIADEIAFPQSMQQIDGISGNETKKEALHIWKQQLIQKASMGMTFLAIVASTSPFIGLFGTVVEILEAFFYLGGGGKVAFDTVAPIISKALIATAAGILTAIPAYSFHLILKRKLYDFGVLLQIELDLLFARREECLRF